MDDDLAEFIKTSFGSIWTLELLLLVSGAPDRVWSRGELVTELRSSEQVVARSTEDLVAAGLVFLADAGAIRFGPASRDLEDLVQKLGDEYRRTPAAIRRVILNSASGKLRSFIDAFDLRKNK